MLELFLAYDRWGGLVPLLGGIYASLLGFGYLPRKPKDPETWAEWYQRHGRTLRFAGPCMILGGAVTLGFALAGGPSQLPARRVFVEFHQANADRQQRGNSLSSAQQFVADLRQLDLSRAPENLRSALTDYTAALAEGLAALQAGRSTAEADARMAEARRRLDAIEKTYFAP